MKDRNKASYIYTHVNMELVVSLEKREDPFRNKWSAICVNTKLLKMKLTYKRK